MKYPASHLSPFPPSFPRRPSASHSIRAPRFLACPFADYVRKSFIYRFYAESASKSFIYRIYVSAPGCGGLSAPTLSSHQCHERSETLLPQINFLLFLTCKVQGCIPNLGNGTGGHMSVFPNAGNGKVTVPELLQRKASAAASTENSKKIVCLTAYDYPTARLLDEAGVDVILVGDSLAMVVLGHDSTLPVTIDEMLHHTRAVRRGTKHALVVADMPFGSYHADTAESLRNAVRFVKEAGAKAVKVEAGEGSLQLMSRLTEAEIPVMGHICLTPQSVNALGGCHFAVEADHCA